MKYAVVSDIHAHSWTVFGRTGDDDVNTRLRIVLDELLRAAKTLLAAGGSTLVIPGDVFHLRGQIDPEVLNPVRQTFNVIRRLGIDIMMIPGNHDLKTRNTRALSSSIENLQGARNDTLQNMGYCKVFNEPTFVLDGDLKLAFVPWCETHDELFAAIETTARYANGQLAETDLFIHAGIDGVLSGTPASGLTASRLAAYGFRRVFAGHYHNHADMGLGVFSVGATTHQNWGDVNTRAGFLIVDTDPACGSAGVTFNDTLAPKFVDLTGMDEDEMEMECRGNYVRYSGPEMTQTEIDQLRSQFRTWGALETSILVPKSLAATRTTAPSKGLSLAQSVDAFVDASTMPTDVDPAAVKTRAAQVLLDAQTVREEA
jgi:DNA repair exonuclease SbcCD nuclease subunit